MEYVVKELCISIGCQLSSVEFAEVGTERKRVRYGYNFLPRACIALKV